LNSESFEDKSYCAREPPTDLDFLTLFNWNIAADCLVFIDVLAELFQGIDFAFDKDVDLCPSVTRFLEQGID
jgi:hypothetical protein